MSGFHEHLHHPAFELGPLLVPFEYAIVAIGLGIVPFLSGWMFQRSRLAATLCFLFTGMGGHLSLRYQGLVEIRGDAHGLIDSEGTFNALPIYLGFAMPCFGLGLLAHFVIRRFRDRNRSEDAKHGPGLRIDDQ